MPSRLKSQGLRNIFRAGVSAHRLEFHTLVLIFLPARLRSRLLTGPPSISGKKKERFKFVRRSRVRVRLNSPAAEANVAVR